MIIYFLGVFHRHTQADDRLNIEIQPKDWHNPCNDSSNLLSDNPNLPDFLRTRLPWKTFTRMVSMFTLSNSN